MLRRPSRERSVSPLSRHHDDYAYGSGLSVTSHVALPSKTASTKAAVSNQPQTFDWIGELRKRIGSSSYNNNQQQSDTVKKTYNVLSQRVRHELNKYFFDVTDSPSRAERKKLLSTLWLIDYTVTMAKLVKYFQNKRHYVKNRASDQSTSVASLNLWHADTVTRGRRVPKEIMQSNGDSSNSDSELNFRLNQY